MLPHFGKENNVAAVVRLRFTFRLKVHLQRNRVHRADFILKISD